MRPESTVATWGDIEAKFYLQITKSIECSGPAARWRSGRDTKPGI